VRVICVNSKNKPDIIPDDEWVVEGEVYTVTEVRKMGLQINVLGYEFEEISLSEKSAPYEFYDAARFEILFDVTLRDIMSEDLEDEEILEPADFDLI